MNPNCIPTDHRSTIARLFKSGDQLRPQLTDDDVTLLHAAIGIAGEASELEKAVFPVRLEMAYKMSPAKRVDDGQKNSPWDGYDGLPGIPVDNLVEEIGDILFYDGALRIAACLEDLGVAVMRQPSLWRGPGPMQRASNGHPRKLVLCELISLNSVIAGDILDLIKKVVMYRKPMPVDKLTVLLLDQCWVLAAIASIIGFSEENIRDHNMDKLERGANARYKGGYTDEAAQAREDKKGEEEA